MAASLRHRTYRASRPRLWSSSVPVRVVPSCRPREVVLAVLSDRFGKNREIGAYLGCQQCRWAAIQVSARMVITLAHRAAVSVAFGRDEGLGAPNPTHAFRCSLAPPAYPAADASLNTSRHAMGLAAASANCAHPERAGRSRAPAAHPRREGPSRGHRLRTARAPCAPGGSPRCRSRTAAHRSGCAPRRSRSRSGGDRLPGGRGSARPRRAA